MFLTSACTTFAPRSEEVVAVCDSWRSTIVVTERDDRRALREQELLARETHKEIC